MTPEFQTRRRTLILIIVLFATMRSFGQVYSSGIYSAGTTTYKEHCIGPDSFRIGFQEDCFLTDADGKYVINLVGRPSQPGDTPHTRTWIYLGPVYFSVPLPPGPFFVICGVGLLSLLALADFGWKQLRRRRQEPKVT